MSKKEKFGGIKIEYSCVCNTEEERNLFVDFIAEMKKLKSKAAVQVPTTPAHNALSD